MFELTEEAARAVYTCSNVVLVVGGFLVAFATLTLFWSGAFVTKAAGEKLLEGQRALALSQEGEARANAAASEANAAAAAATARAAKANEDMTEALDKMERLEGKLGWRTITAVQAKLFAHAAERLPKGKIEVHYVANDIEAASFALELSTMLSKAGYDAPRRLDDITPSFSIDSSVQGLEIAVTDERNAAAGYLQEALKGIGVPSEGRLIRGGSDNILLRIGRKGP